MRALQALTVAPAMPRASSGKYPGHACVIDTEAGVVEDRRKGVDLERGLRAAAEQAAMRRGEHDRAGIRRPYQRRGIERKDRRISDFRVLDCMPRLLQWCRLAHKRRIGIIQASERVTRRHTRSDPERGGAHICVRDHAPRETVFTVADTRRPMPNSRRRHAERIEVGQAADAGALAADPSVGEDHRLQPRLRREIRGIDAAVRGGERDAAARVLAERW